jgi:ankyrin repeat protein
LATLLASCDMPAPASLLQSNYGAKQLFKDPHAQALAIAAEHGNAEAVRRLMKQEHVNPDVIFSDDDSGMPLLAWPIFTHSPEGLRAMLENGADPNARRPERNIQKYEDGSVSDDYRYDNAIVWAAKQDDSIYLTLLLDHGGDPNTRNVDGDNLLFQAFIWHNQWQNVQLLVERGADVNVYAGMGGSILDAYAGRGGFEQAYWLLQHGADPKVNFLTKPDPLHPNDYLIIADIFWHPGNPNDPTWQRKCQQWALQHGFVRSPMPDYYQRMRKNLGFPYEEKDIPLL